ncbi:hypothetical protein GCM10009764_63670 [Nocardia ninae]|uniref:Uncharacterized protein n=1 Tax=Nocardia ninae NBRC 108245 TaxID=1210091 RepID=A0A511MK03_9NOCA|nr:hypothetical protein NN4_54380 [Nocardia ninae NBRC 108245]
MPPGGGWVIEEPPTKEPGVGEATGATPSTTDPWPPGGRHPPSTDDCYEVGGTKPLRFEPDAPASLVDPCNDWVPCHSCAVCNEGSRAVWNDRPSLARVPWLPVSLLPVFVPSPERVLETGWRESEPVPREELPLPIVDGAGPAPRGEPAWLLLDPP